MTVPSITIPVEKALEVIRKRLETDKNLNDRCELNVDQVSELLELCLTSTYFVYQGKYYPQKQGAAMGSPVSPIVANLYMEFFERQALDRAKNPPSLWVRYVDDTMTKIHEYDIDQFTEHLNSIDPHIKFTSEQEEDGKIPFLDTCIHVRVTVYRKPTHTDQYLNFNSNHHLEHKRSVVRTLLHRANTLVTNESDKKKEIEHVKTALRANGYPEWIFQLHNKKSQQDKTQNSATKERRVNVGMPYIRGTSEVLARVFKNHGVNMFHKPYNSIRSQVTRVKDQTDKLKKCGIIYHVKCKNCKEDYIGETARTLETRLKEHVTRTNSAIHEHCQNTGHTIKSENTKILTSESGLIKRKVKEAIEIKQRRPSLNRDEGLELPPRLQTSPPIT
ncbi:uncharacterized protein LOC123531409 [Mercenaria mercenaria]|uniref:uncharacterized protein LOC123531409 n=1 Tax=Mercenaria mercenaria TaxID=6596 RepID=UPI00234E9136|nr:uncharacterized protein LOC123531409 [Mercenaria mercenaria]